jgi:hypothetical protein
MKKKAYGIYLFLIGLLLVALEWTVSTGKSYGFTFGVNEGMKKGLSTFFLEELIGENVSVDIFFNPLGYVLIILGLAMIAKAGKQIKNIRIAAVIGFAASVVKIILPFTVGQYSLLKPILLCMIVEFAVLMAIIYSFAIACRLQVNDFNNMEVRKDLLFAVELYGVTMVMSYILLPLKAMYIYFARGVYVVTIVLAAAAIIYYCVKAAYYTNKFKLFQNIEEKSGNRMEEIENGN